MKETRRKVGLHTIVTTDLELIDEHSTFPRRPSTSQRLVKWAEDIDGRCEELLSDEATAEGVREFAMRCRVPAATVLNFLRKAAVLRSLSAGDAANAMEAAADLQDEWQSLIVEDSLARPMKGAIATSEGGSKGATARHAKASKRVALRWTQAISLTRTLNAVGRSRREILEAVAKKVGVKASTLIKNPAIRAHLPAYRRNPRG